MNDCIEPVMRKTSKNIMLKKLSSEIKRHEKIADGFCKNDLEILQLNFQEKQLERIKNRDYYTLDEFNSLIIPNPVIADSAAKLKTFFANIHNSGTDTIILNVDIMSGNFTKICNNRWVGLRIDHEIRTIIYVDPLGRNAHPEILKTISGVTQYRIKPMYTTRLCPQRTKIRKKTKISLEGNDVDCGPFLINALEILRYNTINSFIMLRLEASEILSIVDSEKHGTRIRKKHIRRVKEVNKNFHNVLVAVSS